MPYEVRFRPKLPPRGRPWKIWNLDKRKYVGSSKTKKNAEASVRARLMGEFGGKK